MSEKIQLLCLFCAEYNTFMIDKDVDEKCLCKECNKVNIKIDGGVIYIRIGIDKWTRYKTSKNDDYRTAIKLKNQAKTEFKILMSRDNPKGRKLEELLQDILDDILLKNKVLGDGDPSIDKIKITANNTVIIALLETAIFVQDRTMKLLNDMYGSDRGPGDPRL